MLLLIRIFSAIAIIMVVYTILRLHKEKINAEKIENVHDNQEKINSMLEMDIPGELQYLHECKSSNNVDVRKVAFIMASLVVCGYIPVHLLINEGNNYDDDLQKEGYSKSLTEKNLNALKILEGKYG